MHHILILSRFSYVRFAKGFEVLQILGHFVVCVHASHLLFEVPLMAVYYVREILDMKMRMGLKQKNMYNCL